MNLIIRKIYVFIPLNIISHGACNLILSPHPSGAKFGTNHVTSRYQGFTKNPGSEVELNALSFLTQSRSPSLPVRRLRVGIALEKSNCSRWISNVSSTHARQLLQNINKVFRICRKFDTFYN